MITLMKRMPTSTTNRSCVDADNSHSFLRRPRSFDKMPSWESKAGQMGSVCVYVCVSTAVSSRSLG